MNSTEWEADSAVQARDTIDEEYSFIVESKRQLSPSWTNDRLDSSLGPSIYRSKHQSHDH
jgi:hypothetical protein